MTTEKKERIWIDPPLPGDPQTPVLKEIKTPDDLYLMLRQIVVIHRKLMFMTLGLQCMTIALIITAFAYFGQDINLLIILLIITGVAFFFIGTILIRTPQENIRL